MKIYQKFVLEYHLSRSIKIIRNNYVSELFDYRNLCVNGNRSQWQHCITLFIFNQLSSLFHVPLVELMSSYNSNQFLPNFARIRIGCYQINIGTVFAY